ncbi:hypothetical protein [Streptococcus oralis]|uniref:hypothetical protein n=1 Tax=Streptococcus oralis TaxID=1303 RepID=UPI001E44CBEA|nr:hypothetical protein [Streptococcus oralis]
MDGVEKSRKEVSRKTKKEPKTRLLIPVQKRCNTKEVTKTEEVAFRLVRLKMHS